MRSAISHKAAKDLLAWSNKNKERLTSMVQTEVKSQLKTIGVASRDEVDALLDDFVGGHVGPPTRVRPAL